MSNNEPHIGIFFIIGDNIYISADKVSNIKADMDGFKSYDKNHKEYWNTVCFLAPECKNHDYKDYPRGRVNYCSESDMFIVSLDYCISDIKYQDLICKRFYLEGKNIEFMPDDLYLCPKCKDSLKWEDFQ